VLKRHSCAAGANTFGIDVEMEYGRTNSAADDHENFNDFGLLHETQIISNDHGHDCCDGDGDDYSGDGSDATFLVVEKQYNKSGKTTIRKGRTDCGQSANNGPEQQEAEKEKEE